MWCSIIINEEKKLKLLASPQTRSVWGGQYSRLIRHLDSTQLLHIFSINYWSKKQAEENKMNLKWLGSPTHRAYLQEHFQRLSWKHFLFRFPFSILELNLEPWVMIMEELDQELKLKMLVFYTRRIKGYCLNFYLNYKIYNNFN